MASSDAGRISGPSSKWRICCAVSDGVIRLNIPKEKFAELADHYGIMSVADTCHGDYSIRHVVLAKDSPAHEWLSRYFSDVPAGQKMPVSKLAAAKRSKSPAIRREATFAQNAKRFKH